MLDENPVEKVQPPRRKALLLYMRGKCLDYMPEYTKQAEDCLR